MAESVAFEVSSSDLRGIEEAFFVPLAQSGAILIRDAIVAEVVEAAPRTGRVYRLPDANAVYRASAPGEPPAERTGSYAASWYSTIATVTPEGVVAFAVSDELVDGGLPLGLLLEEGTEDMEPRFHIARALVEAARAFRISINKIRRR